MTNDLHEMHIDTILLDVSVDNVKQAFEKLTGHISQLIGTPEKFLMGMLMEREENQNSGIGNGVAVLDAKLPRLTQPMIVYMKLNKAIEYHAADGEPVDMITLVLSPDFENFQHLQRIAMVARFFSNHDARDLLHQADDYNGVRMAVQTINKQKKAA